MDAAMTATGSAPIGKQRNWILCVVFTFITFGIYRLYWEYVVHEELKQQAGVGPGGALALILTIFAGVVMPFLTPMWVAEAHQKAGRTSEVSALTGLWVLPGILLCFVGPFIWWAKTQGELNKYWETLGAPPP